MFRNLNKLGQKVSKVTKAVSDLNALEQMTQGNTKPAKRKVRNKVKNKLWNLIK